MGKELGKEIWLQTKKGFQGQLKNVDYPMKQSTTYRFLSRGRTVSDVNFRIKGGFGEGLDWAEGRQPEDDCNSPGQKWGLDQASCSRMGRGKALW